MTRSEQEVDSGMPLFASRAQHQTVERKLRRAYERCLRDCGPLSFSIEQFSAYVQEIGRRHNLPPKRLHLGDLLLAQAALGGSSNALAFIVERVERAVLKHARRAGVSPEEADDEWQALAVRLVDPSSRSLLEGFTGRASLELYLRTVHLRAIFRRRRTPHLEVHKGAEKSALETCLERERESILHDLVRTSLSELAPQQSELLRRHHEHGEALTTVCLNLGLLSGEQAHLRKAASRLHQRAVQCLRQHVLERARQYHGVDAEALQELLPRVETYFEAERWNSRNEERPA